MLEGFRRLERLVGTDRRHQKSTTQERVLSKCVRLTAGHCS
jgi:hypothetical protein